MRRAGIIAYGAVTPLGVGIEQLSRALRDGLRTVGKVDYPAPRGKNLAGLAPEPFRNDPFRAQTMVRAAVQEAIGTKAPDKCGLILSTIAGGSEVLECCLSPFFESTGQAEPDAAAWVAFHNDELARAIAREFCLTGPRLVLSNACASGNLALGVALDWIRDEVVDHVVVVGVDVLKSSSLWAAEASGFVGRSLQPFDEARSGTILGEGAGAILLAAAETGSNVRGWLDGFGCVCERGAAAIVLTEDGDGLTRAMAGAIADAGVDWAGIDLVSAHAPGTRGIDAIECRAIAAGVGGLRPPLINAAKSLTTHMSGASAVVEAIAACEQMQGGYAHGNLGLERAGADIALPVLGPQRIDAPIGATLSNACGGGGTNTTVILRRSDRAGSPPKLRRRRVGVTAIASVVFPREMQVDPAQFEGDCAEDYSRCSRAARFAAAAGRCLLRDFTLASLDAARVAVIGGTSLGGSVEAQEVLMQAMKRDPCYVLPSEALGHGIHYGTSLVAREHDLRGYTATVNGSALAGIKALALSVDCVSNHRADAAVCVVYDTAELPFEACPPYPEGELEGAVAVLLEPLQEKQARLGSLQIGPIKWTIVAAAENESAAAAGAVLPGLATGPVVALVSALEASRPFRLQFADGPSGSWIIAVAEEEQIEA